MSKRKVPFTFDEHMVAGHLFREIEDRISLLAMSSRTAYGKEVESRFERLRKAAKDAKSVLDDKVCAEFPMSVERVQGYQVTNVYYGRRNDVLDVEAMTGYADQFRTRLGQMAGLAEADITDRKPGRPRAIDEETLNQARVLVEGGKSVPEAARELRLASSTLYRYLQPAE